MMNNKYYLNNVPYNSASERQAALRASIPALAKPAPLPNGHVYKYREEIMVPASPGRFQDVLLGFFGWVIFSNIAMLTLFFSVVSSLGKLAVSFLLIGVGLLLIISIIALLWKKRAWAFVGVAAALALNFGLWVTVGVGRTFISSMEMEYLILFTLNPFPLGFLLFMC
jgi:hypothetical protein